MTDPGAIRDAMQRYVKYLCDSDIDGIMGLFGEDPTVEDPVGRPAIVGAEAVRAFYAGATQALRVELTGPIRVAGQECAMPMLAEIDLGDRKSYVDVIDVMRFDADGKVVSMRAFWNPGEMRPER
jgi:steroid delta-isomerase